MNENKKLIIILAVIITLVVGIFGLTVMENLGSNNIYKQFEEKFNGTENTLVYIGRPTCGYCNLLTPSLEDMKNRYGFDYIYINTDEISSSILDKILNKLQITSLGTPYMAVVSNGKVVDVQNGYADYDVVFKFLQKNSIIASDAKLLLNYIGIEEYNKIIKDKGTNIVVIGQSQCSYCIKAKTILNEIASKNDIKINYLNLSYLTKDEIAKFQTSFDYFEKEEWGTPLTLIIKKGKIIDVLEYLETEEGYIKFFEENGVL